MAQYFGLSDDQYFQQAQKFEGGFGQSLVAAPIDWEVKGWLMALATSASQAVQVGMRLFHDEPMGLMCEVEMEEMLEHQVAEQRSDYCEDQWTEEVPVNILVRMEVSLPASQVVSENTWTKHLEQLGELEPMSSGKDPIVQAAVVVLGPGAHLVVVNSG